MLAALLDRLEKVSGHRYALEQAERRLELRCEDLERRAAAAEASLKISGDRLADLRAAEAKVEEWALYAADLRAAISPQKLRHLRKPPKPLETDIPF